MKKRIITFSKRNSKEILRDPLSWIFCVGVPVAMLVMFRVISVSTGENLTQFSLTYLTPGMVVFSFSFVALFMAINVSKDKNSSFLTRMFSSPMSVSDFFFGYFVPGAVIAFVQEIICFVASAVLALANGESINIVSWLVSVPVLYPLSLLAISFGITAGCLFSDKSAPGICSVVITASGMLSGAWMPLETMGTFCTVCRCLPYYPAVRLGREAFSGFSGIYGTYLLDAVTVAVYTATAVAFGFFSMKKLISKDK